MAFTVIKGVRILSLYIKSTLDTDLKAHSLSSSQIPLLYPWSQMIYTQALEDAKKP